MNKKILITGSCGFVGSNLIRKFFFEKLPCNVISIDRVNNNSNSLYWNKGHTFHIADIRDQHIIDTIFKFESPDIVIHAAAETSHKNSINANNDFMSSNVMGTQTIINACVSYNVKKFIYLSTDKVYDHLNSESETLISETSIPNPKNSYTASKIAGELVTVAAGDQYNLIYNIIRLSNNYGPHQSPTKLIPKIIKCILNNESVPIYNQGFQIRDWSHVFDSCEAIMTIINNGKPNEIYNVGSNHEISNIELVQKICTKMNKGHNLITCVDSLEKEGFRYAMDISKLKSLNWKPEIKLSNGLESCINWYLMNQWILK